MKKSNHTLTVSCPQCGSEVKSQAYTYMMECDRCLSKKDE
ncbi:YhfH family protein [Halobacillus yeomjeoni]|uniref:YhfH family protein n=1 Tax=Halobacillus yeomjeoni TaxID=311194 RepID=A0A931MWD4_9BACI|nr:YhfH family protein [Halobacillus yeomjeoni]MBH0231507.1 YhfH family protein [Halobacillus yeomjeoni]MCA0984427.1 YhfH family protein [Halobacillus yeomjeoni]